VALIEPSLIASSYVLPNAVSNDDAYRFYCPQLKVSPFWQQEFPGQPEELELRWAQTACLRFKALRPSELKIKDLTLLNS
jgi:hypothetical protein